MGFALARRAMADFAALHVAGSDGGQLDLSVVEPPLRQPEYGAAMLSTLAKQPAEFVRRVVLCSIESALQLRSFASQGARSA